MTEEQKVHVAYTVPEPVFDYVLSIAPMGRELVKIGYDGVITYGPDYKPDEAARAFWQGIAGLVPDTVSKLAAENAELRQRLSDGAPRWIPVTERLPDNPGPWQNPESRTYVLAVDARGRMSVGYCIKGYYRSTGDPHWVFAKPISAPTHWMPLPEPPTSHSSWEGRPPNSPGQPKP